MILCVYHVHAVLAEARRGHGIPWNGVTDGLSHHVGAGNQNWSSGKAPSALNHWATLIYFEALIHMIFLKELICTTLIVLALSDARSNHLALPLSLLGLHLVVLNIFQRPIKCLSFHNWITVCVKRISVLGFQNMLCTYFLDLEFIRSTNASAGQSPNVFPVILRLYSVKYITYCSCTRKPRFTWECNCSVLYVRDLHLSTWRASCFPVSVHCAGYVIASLPLLRSGWEHKDYVFCFLILPSLDPILEHLTKLVCVGAKWQSLKAVEEIPQFRSFATSQGLARASQ